MITDVTVVVLAVALAQWLRFGAVPGSGEQVFDLGYSLVSLILIVIWVSSLGIYRARASKILGAGPEEYRQVATATFATFGALAIISLLIHVEIARGYLAIALPLGLVGLLMGRRVARALVASKRRQGHYLRSVLVIGQPGPARDLVASLARCPDYGYSVVGICQPGNGLGGSIDLPGVGRIPIIADEGDIGASIAQSAADTVALTTTERLGSEGIRALSWQLEKLDIDLLVSPGMVGLGGPRLTMRPVADLPLIHLDKPQYDGAKRFEKRAFDMSFALLVLLAAAPLLIAAAIAVKLTSRGSVIYKSERIGIDGKPFKMWKIRTMVADAEQRRAELTSRNEVEGGVIFKMRRDPRVTPVGRILRRYSIDELPQFVNVLRREMSVVGPRPPLPAEVESYDSNVRRRLLVRPGITGLWQISGRSNLTWDDLVRLDLSYVENWSMMSDLVISAKTARVVLSGKGAY